MTDIPPRWIVLLFWAWVVGVMGAYLFQFRDIAERLVDFLSF